MSDKTKSYSCAVLESVITVLLFACMLIPSIAGSSPSQTLIVENTTHASIRVYLIQAGHLETPVEVPAKTTKTFPGYLSPAGRNYLVLEAYCLEPPIQYQPRPLIVEKYGKKAAKVVVTEIDFGKSFMADKEGCGIDSNNASPSISFSCDDISGDWEQSFGTSSKSTWILQENGIAKETGLGKATGKWELHGKVLKVTWSCTAKNCGVEMEGSYNWTLNSTCSKGEGPLEFTKGRDGKVTSNVTKVKNL